MEDSAFRTESKLMHNGGCRGSARQIAWFQGSIVQRERFFGAKHTHVQACELGTKRAKLPLV